METAFAMIHQAYFEEVLPLEAFRDLAEVALDGLEETSGGEGLAAYLASYEGDLFYDGIRYEDYYTALAFAAENCYAESNNPNK